ncbi:LuxR C-terminal-related transcriptional regulator, partial [Rhizobium johnstonii]
TFSTERHVVPALRAGSSGYLVKDTDPDDILEAIREVCAGRSVISPRATRDLILSLRADLGEASGSAPIPVPLSPRELSIVQSIAQGWSNAEIARELHLAEPTVKSNLGRVMSKWGVRDRVQVLIYAITKNIV